MDNGDSTIARYEGTMQMKKDGSGTDKGTWRYVRGTGKFSGIKGSGTFKGAAAADGTGWVDVTGVPPTRRHRDSRRRKFPLRRDPVAGRVAEAPGHLGRPGGNPQGEP